MNNQKIIKFENQIILAGPKVNLHLVCETLKLMAVEEEVNKSIKQEEILFCRNLTRLRPEHAASYSQAMQLAQMNTIPLEWYETVPVFFWQSRMWWNYYHNVKHNRKTIIKTLNIPKQQSLFFNDVCIYEQL